MHRGASPHSQFLKPAAREKEGITAIFVLTSHRDVEEYDLTCQQMPYLDFELHNKQREMTEVIDVANRNKIAPMDLLNYKDDFGVTFTEDEQKSIEASSGALAEDGISTTDALALGSTVATTFLQQALESEVPRPGELADDGVDIRNVSTEDAWLVNAYLRHEPSLHIRRTLDQYYYFMLDDTRARDSDQVVYRWETTHKKAARPMIIMVNQLWLWIFADGS